MIIELNDSRTLIKHISCNCTCKIMVKKLIQIKNEITESVGASVRIQQNMLYAKKVLCLKS